jgi:hypothetical protein
LEEVGWLDREEQGVLADLDAGRTQAVFTSSSDLARWAEQHGYVVGVRLVADSLVYEIWPPQQVEPTLAPT